MGGVSRRCKGLVDWSAGGLNQLLVLIQEVEEKELNEEGEEEGGWRRRQLRGR